MLPSEPHSASSRVAGFMALLRRNGFAVGPGETELVLSTLAETGLADAATIRLGLKTMLSGDRTHWERFDGLFDAYWFDRGLRVVAPAPGRAGATGERRRPDVWDKILPPGETGSTGPAEHAAEGRAGSDGPGGTGRLLASGQEALARVDLRRLTSAAEIAEAERVAERLASAMRYRLSRRRTPARRGDTIDLRRTIRRSLPRGGEPVELLRKHRPERPVNLVVLLDVSGSMNIYSRYFLSFVRGLVGTWLRTDVLLFHTRLVRITEALHERDAMRAMGRLSLLAEGFGGGTRIATALKSFNDRYAKTALDSRSVVIVMSDGYDTDPPEALTAELRRLKRRARRLIWLNPLLGWKDYAPVARAMAAALPFIDFFAAAHSLASLAALEGELARL
jgi:uncharacterized protein with von Willebrand factor type A (vWA) domain